MASGKRQRVRLPAAPRQSRAGDPPAASPGWAERALEEIVTATYWFEPGAAVPAVMTIRFSGRRTGIVGRPTARDRFVQEETIEALAAGSGPVSVTTRVHGVNPGTWIVTAEEARGRGLAAKNAKPTRLDAGRPARRPWPWVAPIAPAEQVHSAVRPLARIPGVIPGAWLVLVTLGIVLALAVQAALHEPGHGSVLAVSIAAVAGGTIAAKAWYIVVHGGRRYDGWCIQGFIAGAVLVGTGALLLLRLPVGVVLDATAPGLFLGVAVGRPGCFLAGCCSGRPTTSRWGLWSSDQRIGARRIPTQLLESLLGLVIGGTALLLVVDAMPVVAGSISVGALAAYTLGRQFILSLRSEPRLHRALGRSLTLAVAALVLVSDLVLQSIA